MSELVTMVFTDLVNSTAVKRRMEGRDVAERNVRYYQEILQPHRDRVEEGLEKASGRVVSTQGDGYFLVFRDLLPAIHWCVELQRDHERRPIPTPLGPQLVKIAIHVGSPLLDGDNFIGHEVDYAARIGGLCHGGQILVSETVSSLMRSAELTELTLHCHGDWSLKGVGSVPIFEVLYDGRPNQPLRQELAPEVELPPLPESFVGRQDLLDTVTTALAQGGVVVLRGEGGIGKTAVALVAAHAHGETAPVAWIYGEQAPGLEDCLRDVAMAFWGDTLDPLGPTELRRRIHDHSVRTGALIVLDNFETVAGDVEILRWLASLRAPARALVTTREVPAALRGNIIPVHELSRDEAVKLFNHRLLLSGGRPPQDPGVVDELCAAVGNSPLAVELLAGRAARTPLTRLLERLRHSLAVVDSGGDSSRPARHQSARSCFSMSYETLSPTAQRLLTHLALWPDGVGLELLHTTMPPGDEWDDAAEALVGASLWRLEDDRYEVHPLVRSFALEMLGSERTSAVGLGVEAMARVAEAKSQHLGDASASAVFAASEWFDDEWTNVLTAVDLAFDLGAWSVVGSLARSIVPYWVSRGLSRDVVGVYQKAQMACEALDDVPGAAHMRGLLALTYRAEGRWTEAESLYRQSLEMLQSLGTTDSAAEAEMLSGLGRVLLLQRRYGEAEELLRRGLAVAEGTEKARSLSRLGDAWLLRADWRRPRRPGGRRSDSPRAAMRPKSGATWGNSWWSRVVLMRPSWPLPRI